MLVCLSLCRAIPSPCPQGYARPPFVSPQGYDQYSGCPPGPIGPDTCCGCPAGMYQPQAGQRSCERCAPGKYSTTLRAIDESACWDCPAGYSTSTWDDGVCNDGSCYYGQPLDYADYQCCSKCSLCPKGLYQGLVGQASCIGCPVGQHSESKGQTNTTGCNYNHVVRDAFIGFGIVFSMVLGGIFLLVVPAKLLV